jgi:hypothetical protein
MIKTDKKLKEIWKKYINQKIYRVIPFDQKAIVLKKGFDPKKDPYEKINNKVKKMFGIVKKLERKGIIFEDIWGGKPVKGSTVIKVGMRSVRGDYIDFVASKKQIQIFKKRWDGGCLATYVFKLTEFLLENSDKLNPSEKKLVTYLNKWAFSKRGKKSVTLFINGSNKIFESALFYTFSPQFKRYWKSPFGSVEHFKKVIKEKSLRKYLPYLRRNKLFYLRVKEKISPKEIKLLRV